MKRLNKKQIIIIISVAIVIIALAIAGIIFGINNGKKKETTKNDGKIESVEKDEADEEEEDETDAVEDETTENTTEQEANTQTPVVEEPKQETQQQTTTNTNQNQNQNNNNTGNNSGNNNSSSNNGTTNNATSNNNQGNASGNTGGSATGGMYTPGGDSISFERMNKCASILDGGMASSFVPVDRGQSHVAYWNGKIWISAESTSGAWMYVCLAGWYADTTNVGSDETRPGYAEIPSLVKQCLETIAPEGGTELYNKVSALVSQYGSDYQVPTQGRISESIPGLYVTLEKGKSGLEIRFWAE